MKFFSAEERIRRAIGDIAVLQFGDCLREYTECISDNAKTDIQKGNIREKYTERNANADEFLSVRSNADEIMKSVAIGAGTLGNEAESYGFGEYGDEFFSEKAETLNRADCGFESGEPTVFSFDYGGRISEGVKQAASGYSLCGFGEDTDGFGAEKSRTAGERFFIREAANELNELGRQLNSKIIR